MSRASVIAGARDFFRFPTGHLLGIDFCIRHLQIKKCEINSDYHEFNYYPCEINLNYHDINFIYIAKWLRKRLFCCSKNELCMN